MLAVVCVEGGPSRESLDVIYELLKDQMHPDSVPMDKDEVQLEQPTLLCFAI